MRYINQIFGTNYTKDTLSEFQPMTVKLKKYYDHTLKKRTDIIDEVELTIVSIIDDNSAHDIFCREDDYELFKNVSVINYGLVFDNVSDAIKLLENKPFNNFYVEDSNVKAINLIAKYVSIFRKLSVLLSSILAITGFIFLIFYEVSNISSMKKEIGILKACGTAQRTISIVFIMQQIIVSIMVAILSLILSYLLIETANSLMISSIDKYASVFINELTIIKFIPLKILTILVATIIIIMASCIIPILLLVKVKPMNIIKAKE
jgi:ABC-type antimicrobial peptide transport system permease subunit